MALLSALGLKPTLNVAKALVAKRATEVVTTPEGKASGPSATPRNEDRPSPVEANSAEKSKADFEKSWKQTLGFAAGLKDICTKLELAQALKACDEKRKAAQAVAASDPAKHAALMQAATADMLSAREAANHRSEGLARAQAEPLRAAIKKTYENNNDAHAKLVVVQEAKKAALESASAPAKARLSAEKALFDKKVEAAEHKRDQAQADLEALDNPEAKREELAGIVARHKSSSNVVEHTEVDKHENAGRKPGPTHVTTTKTSVKDGMAKVEKTDVRRSIGLGGVTQTESHEREFTTGERTLRSSDETKTQVGLGRYSSERTDKSELERADGNKLSVEETRSIEVGKEGYKKTATRTVTQTDGSSTSTATTKAMDRGEGKVGLSGERAVTATDASGTATTKGGSAKGGLTNGGGYASGKGSVSRQNKDGWKAGAVGGLSASASCVIGDPAGDPPRWPVTTKVTVGASLAVSGGQEKKGAPSKGSVELQASKEFVFEQTHQLYADELEGYLGALKEADKGGRVAKTYRELQVLSVGLSQDWDAARAILDAKTSVPERVGQRAGESATTANATTVGGKLELNARALKIGVSAKETRSGSIKATRNAKGGLDVEQSNAEGSSREGSLGVGIGVVEGSLGRSHMLETSLGYMITIEPGDGVDELLRDFSKCKSPEAQKDFVEKNKNRVRITGRTKGRKQSEGDKVELGVAGVKLRLGNEHGTEESEQTDAHGKVVKASAKGKTKSGGDIGVGSMAVGDSSTGEATATIGEDGDAELEVKTTRAKSNLRKMARKALGRDVETGAKSEPSGLIETIAGKKQDEEEAREQTQDQDVSGLMVKAADLKKIFVISKSDQARWTACAVRMQDYFEWRSVGADIASGSGKPADVAKALSLFVGGGSSSRMEVLENLIRPRGDVSMGTRVAFPESLKELKAPYRRYVVEACEDQIAQTAKVKGPQAAGELGRQMFDELGKLLASISGSKDFTNVAAQAEMIKATSERKTLLLKAMRKNAGRADPGGDAQADKDEYERLVKECESYAKLQEPSLARIKEMVGNRETILVNRDFAEASDLIRKLDELYATWMHEWSKVETVAKKVGKSESEYGRLKPKLDDYPRLKKACFM